MEWDESVVVAECEKDHMKRKILQKILGDFTRAKIK